MTKIYLCFLLFLSLTVPAQDSFGALKDKIEQEILYSQYRQALDLINNRPDDLLKAQQAELDVLKVRCLNNLDLIDEAFALSQNILSQKDLPPVLRMRTHMQRALIYEIGLNKSSCKKELDIAEAILNKNPSLKPSYYTYFLIRKASFYRQFGDHKKALQVAVQAEKYAEKVNDQKNGAALNMFMAYASYDEPEKALNHFGKAIQIYKNHRNYSGTAEMFNNVSRFYFDRNQTDLARKYVDSAIALESNVEISYIIADSYRLKSQIAERQNRFEEALADFKTAFEWTEKETLEQRDTKVQELDLMYDFEADKLREQEMSSSIKSTKRWNSMLAICTILLVFFMLVLLRVVMLLSRSKARIKVQNASISEKNAVLKKNVEEKEFLVRELNHRVKNNLAVILSLVGFQRDETEIQVYKRKFEQLYSRINTIKLAHHLFSYNVDNFDRRSVEINAYSDKIIELHKAGATQPLLVETQVDEFHLPVDLALSYGLLLNELLTNTLKHAVPDEGNTLEIVLKVQQIDGTAEVEYSDNGKQFVKNGSDSSSLGKFIIDAMVEQLGGKCDRNQSRYKIIFPATETVIVE